MEPFLFTFLFMLMGMGLRRLPQFPKETSQVLNLFVIYIALPALILLKVPQIRFSQDILTPVIMPWIMLFLSAILVLLAGRFMRWPRKTIGALLLLAPLGNTSFLGIPMIRSFLGETAIPYAVLYDQLGSFLALATYGTVVLALYGSGTKATASIIAKKVVTFPPFLALLLALGIGQWGQLPPLFFSFFEMLSATLVPVVMIAVGFQLTIRLQPEIMAPLGIGITIKLVCAPLLALLGCRLLGIDHQAAQVAVLEAGMPPMVSAGALAIMGGLAPELTAAMVGFGICCSFLTLPLLFQLL